MLEIAQRARAASRELAALSLAQKNRALTCISAELVGRRTDIDRANKLDKEDACEHGVDPALQSRLDVVGKFDTLLAGVDALVRMDDPCNKTLLARELAEGLHLYRVTCPIGVLAIVFESRPEAAVQIATLAIKSGNAVILKGGKEAMRSNQALVDAMRAALVKAKVVPDAIQLVSSKEEVAELLKLDKLIDLVIPRGSNAMVQKIFESTRIPVMGHADGVCFVYLDADASADVAVRVAVDSKTQYPAACNAAETLLVHEAILDSLFPKVAQQLLARGVELVGDARAVKALGQKGIALAPPEFLFDREYLSLCMSVKVVQSLDDAIQFINEHGSHHTDVIVTENSAAADEFERRVDSAGVYHNASSRFADGFRYGFGAEVGVSTSRIHARGPVGVEGLLTYKYVCRGKGHIVSEFGVEEGKRHYTHVDLDEFVGKRLESTEAGEEGAAAKRTKI
jgi:glutamate-5-semialdehyde dehydrogenase